MHLCQLPRADSSVPWGNRSEAKGGRAVVQHGQDMVRSSVSPALPAIPLGQLAELSPAFAALSQCQTRSQGTELNSLRARPTPAMAAGRGCCHPHVDAVLEADSWVALQDPCHRNWSPEQKRNQKCWGRREKEKKQSRQAAQTTWDEGTEPEPHSAHSTNAGLTTGQGFQGHAIKNANTLCQGQCR